MAAYSAIKGGGWTRYYDPLDLTSLDLAKKRECRLPKNYTVLVRNVFEARVDWDGTPTMYHHAGVSDQTSFACLFDSAGDSHDGITTPWSRSPP